MKMPKDSDFDDVIPNYWECQFDDHGAYIAQIVDGVHIKVFFDCAFVLLFHRDEAGTVSASKIAAVHRVKPVFVGTHSVSRIRFTEQPPAVFVDVDGQPIKDETIQRLSFYARTDAGTIVVALAPSFATDARMLSVIVTQQAKVCQVLQALTVGWFDEIIINR